MRCTRPGGANHRSVTTRWVHETAHDVLTTVQSSRAVWQENHVRAEAERRVRAAGVRLSDVDRAVDALVARALSPTLSLPLDSAEPISEPAAFRRSDGTSVYVVAGSKLYTSREIVAAEQAIVAAAARMDGRVIGAETIDIALLESTANGVELNPGQVQLVRELATSGARVQLALAPQAPARRPRCGCCLVRGPATAARSSVCTVCRRGGRIAGGDRHQHRHLAKLIHSLRRASPSPSGSLRSARTPSSSSTRQGWPELPTSQAIEYILDRGGSVRLIGDDQQLAAIGAGGVLRDISEVHGAVTLSQVMRFTDPITGAPNHAEGAASLALRDGDSAAIAYYIDNNRIHVGDLTTATDDAYTAWSVDRAAGRDSIMLAPPEISSPNSTTMPAATASPPTPVRSDGRSRSPTSPRHRPGTRSSPARTIARSRSAHTTGSRTATGGSWRTSASPAHWTSSTTTPAATSPCPPPTSPSTSRWATPPPCTAPRASPPTPATPSRPAMRPVSCCTSR